MERDEKKEYVYLCSKCRQAFSHDDLTVKRAVFQTMGRNQKTLRSRTVSWLCRACLKQDEDYNKKKYWSSPVSDSIIERNAYYAREE